MPNRCTAPAPSIRAPAQLADPQQCFSALQVGLRGYNVCRQLRLLGYDAVNLTGGWKTYQAVKAAGLLPGGATNGAAKL